jgi:sugar transferase EpsL
MNFSQKLLKQLFDTVMSLIFLVVLSPIFILLGIAILIKLGKPICFKQQRPGLHSKPFVMYKFRTMRNVVDEQGNPLDDAMRLTKFGAFLRKYSLDELPELFNVLKGDMSLVGPRPLLMEYLPLYSKEQARRHEVKPGITGWAQINGRNAINWDDKFKLDIWYVDHQSFWLDLKILFFTIIKTIKKEGINQAGHVTAEKFRGNNGK